MYVDDVKYELIKYANRVKHKNALETIVIE